MFARIKYLLHIEKGLVYPRFDSSAQGLMHGCTDKCIWAFKLEAPTVHLLNSIVLK